jgi:hypothetical protein
MAQQGSCTQEQSCGITLLDFFRELAGCVAKDSTGKYGLNVVYDSGATVDEMVIECGKVGMENWEQVLNMSFVTDANGNKALYIIFNTCDFNPQ